MKHLKSRCVSGTLFRQQLSLGRNSDIFFISCLSPSIFPAPCYPVRASRNWGLKSFEKNDILRIVRALAIFRPSLIALQMPLTDEDEIFVEKCFQRSLLVSAGS